MPSLATTTGVVPSATDAAPSTETNFDARPDVASVMVGLTVAAPRYVPATRLAGPVSAVLMTGGVRSILNVAVCHASRMPARS